MGRRNKIRETDTTLSKILTYIFLTFVALCVLYPIVYILTAAFSKGSSISNLDIVPFKNGVTLEHYEYLFSKTNYKQWVFNTFIIATGTCVSTVVVTSLAAYICSRFRFTLKKSILLSFIVLQIFPSFVGMIAIYGVLYRINGIDTFWGIIAVYLAGNIPYNTWMVKSYVDTISRSLDESAKIDGATDFTIFRKIVMPVARPIVILLAITSFTTPWMDFIFPKMVLRNNDKQTVAVGLFSMVSDKRNDFTSFAAGSLLIAIPFIIFFMATQKTLLTSFDGAVKE